MNEIKINGEIKYLPSNWKDITWNKYCEIVRASNKPLIERLAIYSDLPIETLQLLTISSFSSICQMLQFCENYELLNELAKPYENEYFKLGNETYGKLEECKMAARKADNPILAGATIIEKYTGERIADKCVLEVYNQVMFFFAK